jgi:prepilin-type N-terminal cleavage/methylation domain-containing protein
MNQYQKGFSIVELLVVIVTIGILATIVIVSYKGIQSRGYDASVQSDLEGMQGILEAYRARDDGSNDSHQYPLDASTLATLSIKASKGSYDTTVNNNLVYCITDTGANAYKEYKLIALSKSGAIFLMTHDGFIANSLTASNLNASLCSSFSMTLVSNGLSAPNTWQAWVGGN